MNNCNFLEIDHIGQLTEKILRILLLKLLNTTLKSKIIKQKKSSKCLVRNALLSFQ